MRFIIGPDDQRFADGERFVISARGFRDMTGLSEGLAVRTTQVITVVVAIIVVALLFWFLNRTRTGKSMRAYSDNEDLALLSGINPDRVVMVAWLIAAALATIAVGLRLAAVSAPIGAVVGEWVGSAEGLGFLMLRSNQRVEIDTVFAALFVLFALTLAIYGLVHWITGRLLNWSPTTER